MFHISLSALFVGLILGLFVFSGFSIIAATVYVIASVSCIYNITDRSGILPQIFV